jgi:hypothetical protein
MASQPMQLPFNPVMFTPAMVKPPHVCDSLFVSVQLLILEGVRGMPADEGELHRVGV